MANVNITIKRNNSGTYDNLYPKTLPEQVVGLLTDGKISQSYLPSYIIGGLKFIGTQSLSTSTSLATIFGTGTTTNLVQATTADQALQQRGSYVIVTTGGELTSNSPTPGTSAGFQFNAPGDEGDDTTPITLEAGDWIIFRQQVSSGSPLSVVYYFDIINNQYQDATTTGKGVVTLSSQTTYASLTGNNVVTDGRLKTLIDNANFAAAGHLHTGVYQPVDGDLTAIAALAGTSGFLKKTAADTYTLDTATYSTTAHTHGSITSDGKIGSTTDLVVVTGSAGALTTATRSGIDSRTAFPVALATASTIGGIEVGFTSTETNRAVLLSGNDAYVALPRQIPAITLNGTADVTAPGFYAPTASGTSGQLLVSSGSNVAPTWSTINKFLYDTTTGAATGDIIFDNDATA
jgi:hypothetical protein